MIERKFQINMNLQKNILLSQMHDNVLFNYTMNHLIKEVKKILLLRYEFEESPQYDFIRCPEMLLNKFS